MSKLSEPVKHEKKEVQIYQFLSRMLPSLDRFSTAAPENRMSSQESAMLTLHQNIDSLLPNFQRRVIQFIEPRSREGTSTIAGAFGRMAVKRLSKSVLIFDADPRNSGQHFFHGIAPNNGGEEVTKYVGAADKIVYQVNKSNLYLCPIVPNSAMTHYFFDTKKIVDLWKNLKEHFDLIIIDSPPIAHSTDGVAISRNVDGVVLVVEAEKTRWPVVKRTKTVIEKNGGNILGVVFNKRRYHIPDFIYRRL